MTADNLGTYFEKLATQNKKKTAVQFLNGNKISFENLNLNSNKISSWMIKSGVKPNNCICILSNKNEYAFFLIIACLKVGAPYTILDKDVPFSRNARIIKTLKPRFIFSTLDQSSKISKYKNFISRKIIEEILLNQLIKIKRPNFDSRFLAYNMFTSGSTGNPKGVSITHKNVFNFISWAKEEYKINKKDVFSNLNGLHFDNSIFDIFGGLFNGLTLVSVNKEELFDPKKFLSLSKKYKITTWFSVPSLLIYFLYFNAVNKRSFASYNRVIFGGEAFPKKDLKQLFDIIGSRVKIYNVYGPTECTCICSNYKISKFDFSKKEISKYAPLGKKMIKKFDFYILNKNKKSKFGEKGELVLCGPNVGQGYYNNTFETKKRFVQNHLQNKNKKKNIVYMTGDIVYQEKKSRLIYFVSRSDNQIKHLGHRIELDEIEKALNSLDKIKSSVVTYGKKNNIDEITAWLFNCKKKEKEIKYELTKILPNYMIPSRINFLKKVPINNNGKIDRLKIKLNYYD